MPLAGELLRAFTDPQQASVDTSEATTSSSYVDLATVGPSVTVPLLAGQSVLLIVEAAAFISADGANGAVFTVEVAGPGSSDLAAADANGCEIGNTNWTPGTKHTVFTATQAGDHVCTMKYRRINTDTANFKLRRITAIPLP